MLAQQHGVARITVRNAFDLLEADGLIRRVHGSGTFVCSQAHPSTLRGQIDGFVQQAEWLTRNTTVELIEVRNEVPPAGIARTMGLPEGEAAQRSLRLRSYLGKPCLLLDTFVPAWAARLYSNDELKSASLHAALKSAGVRFESADYTVSAAPASGRLAELLDVPVAAALLYMIWGLRDDQGRMVEYQIVHARPDVYTLHTVLNAR